MDPKQNVGAAAPQSKPVASENIMAQGISAKKNSKGMIFGMVFLAILAIGGIGFGIWAWMDGNTQKDSLNQQISDLQKQNIELQSQISNEDEDVNTEYKNPVIKSSNPEEEYGVFLESSVVDEKTARITVKNGKVDICSIYNTGGAFDRDCTIDGISGEIYDVVEFGEGQTNSNSSIGFIMSDGTVQYFPLIAAMNNNDFNIKGTLNIDGFVTDVIEISVGLTDPNAVSGYGSTIFVLRDGSFVKYDESMLD